MCRHTARLTLAVPEFARTHARITRRTFQPQTKKQNCRKEKEEQQKPYIYNSRFNLKWDVDNGVPMGEVI